MSGCAVCVYDLYESALADFREQLASVQKALKAKGVPVSEWPSSLRTMPSPSGEPLDQDVYGAAFRALEKALKEKRSRGD